MNLWTLLIGVVIGGLSGVAVMACCAAAGRADDQAGSLEAALNSPPVSGGGAAGLPASGGTEGDQGRGGIPINQTTAPSLRDTPPCQGGELKTKAGYVLAGMLLVLVGWVLWILGYALYQLLGGM